MISEKGQSCSRNSNHFLLFSDDQLNPKATWNLFMFSSLPLRHFLPHMKECRAASASALESPPGTPDCINSLISRNSLSPLQFFCFFNSLEAFSYIVCFFNFSSFFLWFFVWFTFTSPFFFFSFVLLGFACLHALIFLHQGCWSYSCVFFLSVTFPFLVFQFLNNREKKNKVNKQNKHT